MNNNTSFQPTKLFRFRLPNGDEGTFACANDRQPFCVLFDPESEAGGLPYWGELGRTTYHPDRYQNNSWTNDQDKIADAIRAMGAGARQVWEPTEIVMPKNPPGVYFPRVWRQTSGPSPRATYGRAFTDNLVSLHRLERQMINLFHTVEPESRNDNAFGHAFRDTLLLACSEVELLFRQALRDNGHQGDPKNWKMNEYVKLREPLGLDSWVVKLVDYPDYGDLQPFLGWKASIANQPKDPNSNPGPTDSLKWYAAYHGVKHERDNNFHEANLRNVVSAVAGVFVLLASQFGLGTRTLDHMNENTRLFYVTGQPVFPLADQYVPPWQGSTWQAKGLFS